MAQELFTTQSGDPLKFRISPELAPSIRYDLKSLIRTHGGEIIPAAMEGCIYLIDPQSYKQRKSPDGFEYMSFTFVRTCIEGAKRVLTLQEMALDIPVLLFMEHDKPVAMFLHQTIDGWPRRVLEINITKHGGRLVRDARDARYILVDDKEVALHRSLKKAHQATESYVEYANWVNYCIANKKFKPTPQLIVRMSGKKDGVPAQPFTAKEDSRLIAYIAKRVPFIEAGGRSGRKIYKELTEQLVDKYPWATAHSWQAWRDHYCKQLELFDWSIGKYVDAHPQLRLDYNPRDAYRKKGLPEVYRKLGIPWPLFDADGNGEDIDEDSDEVVKALQPRRGRRKPSKPKEIKLSSDEDEDEDEDEGERDDQESARPKHRTQKAVSEPIDLTVSDDDNQDDSADNQEPELRVPTVSLRDDEDYEDDHQSQFEPIKEGDPKDQAKWAKASRRKNSGHGTKSQRSRSASQDGTRPERGGDEARDEVKHVGSSNSGTKRTKASSSRPAKRRRIVPSSPDSNNIISQVSPHGPTHVDIVEDPAQSTPLDNDGDGLEKDDIFTPPLISNGAAARRGLNDPLHNAETIEKRSGRHGNPAVQGPPSGATVEQQTSVAASRALRSRGPVSNIEALEEARAVPSHVAPSGAITIDLEDVRGPVTRARSRSRSAAPETRGTVVDRKRRDRKGLAPIQERQ